MKKIYSAANITDAYLVQSLLAEALIKTRILNEYAQGGMGEISFTQAYPEIWLLDTSQTEQARHIIHNFEQRDTIIESITCPNCDEPNPETFEVCWRCKTPLTPSTQ